MKVNGSFSTSQGTSLGVLQGSIYISDFFYLVKDTEICNYADVDVKIYGNAKRRYNLSKATGHRLPTLSLRQGLVREITYPLCL